MADEQRHGETDCNGGEGAEPPRMTPQPLAAEWRQVVEQIAGRARRRARDLARAGLRPGGDGHPDAGQQHEATGEGQPPSRQPGGEVDDIQADPGQGHPARTKRDRGPPADEADLGRRQRRGVSAPQRAPGSERPSDERDLRGDQHAERRRNEQRHRQAMVEARGTTGGTHRELGDGEHESHAGERDDGVERRGPRTVARELIGEADGQLLRIAEARLAARLTGDVIAELVDNPRAISTGDAGCGEPVGELPQPGHPSTASTAWAK
jgi:hypothetical protein